MGIPRGREPNRCRRGPPGDLRLEKIECRSEIASYAVLILYRTILGIEAVMRATCQSKKEILVSSAAAQTEAQGEVASLECLKGRTSKVKIIRNSDVEWMIVGHRADGIEAHGDRGAEMLGESDNPHMLVVTHCAAVDAQYDALGACNGIAHARGATLRATRRWVWRRRLVRRRSCPGCLAKIPGNFDIDRTWPPGARLLKSFGEGGGKRGDGCHAKRPLGDRCRSLCREIRALRSMHVLPQSVRWNAARDHHQRDRLEVAVTDRTERIQDTGACGREDGRHLTASHRVSVSHEARVGFMSDGDVLEPRLCTKAFVKPQDVRTDEAERHLDTFSLECRNDDVPGALHDGFVRIGGDHALLPARVALEADTSRKRSSASRSAMTLVVSALAAARSKMSSVVV